MKLLAILNPENVFEEEVKNYSIREAARAIVLDENGKVALLHVSRKNYYKLPGGGIDEGENKESALRRECQEEIGCDIEIVGEVGIIIEHRKVYTLKQTSYCYLAKVRGEKGRPEFTDDEVEEGFTEVWLPYEEAERALSESKATDLEGSAYIVVRDNLFLREAKKHLV